MKRIFFISLIAVFLIGAWIRVRKNNDNRLADLRASSVDSGGTDSSVNQSLENGERDSDFAPVFPLEKAKERVTKKPFGIYITPQNSPVQPERFSGYHTGADFEIMPGEENGDVPVFSVAEGKILMSSRVGGYGGVLIQSTKINNDPATILYGHLSLGSINKKLGDSVVAGEKIGILGKGESQETDGERKHLHLGIHKGDSINVKGYASTKKELDGWIDPAGYASN